MEKETPRRDAAIITVGSELILGLRLDTNTRDVARALAGAGYTVVEALSVGDDVGILADAIARLTHERGLVVVTGGLGPTHDDITREATSRALDLPLVREEAIAAFLEPLQARHSADGAAEQLMTQALVLSGATAIPADSGTAPGQIVPTAAGKLLLLPGPPHEMQPMLDGFLGSLNLVAEPVTLRCAGITESDAQLAAQEALEPFGGVSLTVLAKPSLVDIVLVDTGAGQSALASAAGAVEAALGAHIYARGDTTLAETVLSLARDRGLTICVAESCTGGLLAAALTNVAGSSDVFAGGAVTYANEAKTTLLGVRESTLVDHGAVSTQTAEEMALGAADRFGTDLAVAITGIAGPDGGSVERPVGTVCFALVSYGAVTSESRQLFGDRGGVRSRAVAYALQILRTALLG